ncbi:spore coat protein [Desertibacillus haloalkaliphilus]|nr:spore coat protein [Desertibacillus haloalkaliphilus]
MNKQLGAHETMEIHEVLTSAVNGLNLFKLYRTHVSDPQLQNLMDKQLQFMTQEYNTIVQAVNNRGMSTPKPYRSQLSQAPIYGTQQAPQSESPNMSPTQLDDKDIATGILTNHKASASMKMVAALECADPEIRRMMQQSAVNCSEQAYEVWQYMNQKGYYPVPTMQEQATSSMISSYTPVPQGMNFS